MGWVLSPFFCYIFVFCRLTFSVPLVRWLEHYGFCVYFFVFSLFSLCLFRLSRSYLCKEIVVSFV